MQIETHDLEQWIRRGVEGLTDFFDDKHHCFRRDSLLDDGTNPKKATLKHSFGQLTGATSSNRSFAACAELLYLYQEEERQFSTHPAWVDLNADVEHIVRDMSRHYFTQGLSRLRSHSRNGRNTFTDSHIMLSLTTAASPFLMQVTDDTKAGRVIRRSGFKLAKSLRGDLKVYGGGWIDQLEETNEIVTLHAVRALESAGYARTFRIRRPRLSKNLRTTLRETARDDVLRQLGLHNSNDPEFDPASLMAGVCILHRYGYRSARRLVLRGVHALSDAQMDDGAWRTDLLTLGPNRLVYVSSVEMGNLLCSLALADVTRGSMELTEIAFKSLNKCFAVLESGYLQTTRLFNAGRTDRIYTGWANDQTKQLGVVESWSTAIAVQFLIRLWRLTRAVEQAQLLNSYRAEKLPSALAKRMRPLRWSDLDGLIVPSSSVISPDKKGSVRRLGKMSMPLDQICDPSSRNRVLGGLRDEVVAPVFESTLRKPSGCVSFLLYGPPGTRKTSMVHRLAETLDWPLLVIGPPDFLSQGIDGLENRASEIFHDLMRLRRVVILFDECEELFRRRMPVASPEGRTQGAFITSGMLPRLQDLRNNSWVIFVIATNTELEELDPAVIRQGRLDIAQRVGMPERRAQVRYLYECIKEGGRKLSQKDRARIKEALARYDDKLKPRRKRLDAQRKEVTDAWCRSGKLSRYLNEMHKIRSRESELEHVTFAILERLADSLVSDDKKLSSADSYRALADFCSRPDPRAWTAE